MTSATASGKVDIWRQTLLRYAGYANEVGEAFAPIFPRFLVPSYAISIAYVLGDTADKTKAAYDAQRLSGNVCSTISLNCFNGLALDKLQKSYWRGCRCIDMADAC